MLTPNGGVFGRNPRFNTVTSAGNMTVSAGNLVIGTAGNGISFSATANSSGTMTSELFADYEEGTWSPVYVSQTGTFATMTMKIEFAHYTKIGRMVSVYGHIRTDNVDATGASGTVRISGLPFAVGTSRSAGVIAFASAFAGDFPQTLGCVNGETVLRMVYRATSNGADVGLDVTDLTTGSTLNRNDIYFCATYQA